MPSDWAIFTNRLSAGTVLTLLMASANGTNLMSGGTKATIDSVLAGIEAPYRPGPVRQPQLAVDGGGCAAPDPETQDERLGLLGDQQLQPVGHGLGGLARSEDDVLTGVIPSRAATARL